MIRLELVGLDVRSFVDLRATVGLFGRDRVPILEHQLVRSAEIVDRSQSEVWEFHGIMCRSYSGDRVSISVRRLWSISNGDGSIDVGVRLGFEKSSPRWRIVEKRSKSGYFNSWFERERERRCV